MAAPLCELRSRETVVMLSANPDVVPHAEQQ